MVSNVYKEGNDSIYGKAGNCYDDIIHLPHHVSTAHPPMERTDRAAQFSPFAALTGYEESIEETGRLTEARRELEEDAKAALDEKLQSIQERIADYPKAAITYFLPDHKKEGGAYVTVEDYIKKIDRYRNVLHMQDGTQIPVQEIISITELS